MADMPQRRTWPKGLRVIFWSCVLGFVIGIGQTLYWLLVTHEFFPELTIQGAYAGIAAASLCYAVWWQFKWQG